MYNNQYLDPLAVLSNRKTELSIIKLPATLGRNNNVVDVYFFHESVSREHCRFEVINHRFTVTDLGSTAGTFVNKTRLEPNIPYYIDDGDSLAIGKVKFSFHANYQELAKFEQINMQQNGVAQMQSPQYQVQSQASHYSQPQPMPQMYTNLSNNNMSQMGSQNVNCDTDRIEISSRELREYEYNERSVLYIDCGLTSEVKLPNYGQGLKEEAPLPDKEETAEITEKLTNNLTGHCIRLTWKDEDSGESGNLTIDKFPFYIGRRSIENDYVISKKGVSRKHAHFEENQGFLYICDDNSTNGVRVNGEKIPAGHNIKINSGDIIRIARISFNVQIV